MGFFYGTAARKLGYKSHDIKQLLPPKPLVAAAVAATGVDADVVGEPSTKQTGADTTKLSGLQAANQLERAAVTYGDIQN